MKRKIKILILLVLALGFLGYAYIPLSGISWPAWYALEHPDQLTLYSIKPGLSVKVPASVERLHNYPVLRKVPISSRETRARVAQAIRRGVANWSKEYYLCFDPGYCVRAVCGPFTYDFLICYHCDRVDIYRGNVLVGWTGITDSPDTLNGILAAANVPLPIAPADLQPNDELSRPSTGN